MEKYTTHIKSRTGWFDIDIKELLNYKDLIFLTVHKEFTVMYKQTILGPLWLILNPLITVLLYTFVFGNIAGLSTDGCPQLAFYLASNSLWSYFSACLLQTSNTFVNNAGVFGKVYFPRLVIPIATVVSNLLNLLVQIGMLICVMIAYVLNGTSRLCGSEILFAPILVVQIAALGLGFGVIVSSLTTKYRDLSIVVSFGVQLWMYISPVVYSVSQIPKKYYSIYMLNPIAPIISVWRYAFLGIGEIPILYWIISWITTLCVLVVGAILFSKVEKTFMDTV